MKTTFKFKFNFLFLILVSIIIQFRTYGTNNKLIKVYCNESSKEKKILLKLYNDNTYEFLEFKFVANKPKSIRETGTYVFTTKKLILKCKKQKIYHPTFYYHTNQIKLYTKKLFDWHKEIKTEFVVDDHPKYKDPYFEDSIFGTIYNDKNLTDKIKVPKKYKLSSDVIEFEKSKVDTVINNFYNWDLTETNKVLLNKAKLKQLKVVIVIGNDASSFINEHEEVAVFLRVHGVDVTEIYTPNAKWEKIKEASKGAHIFIYSGHGWISTDKNKDEGIFYLDDGFTYGKQITNELHLNKNALVLFNHVCFGAGSSASDLKDIGINEAVNRVSNYSKIFLNNNIGAYYACNTVGYIKPVLIKFFNGACIKDIYNYEASDYNIIQYRDKYKYDDKYEIAVSGDRLKNNVWRSCPPDKSYYSTITNTGFKNYDCAYVGKPNFTVNDFFKK